MKTARNSIYKQYLFFWTPSKYGHSDIMDSFRDRSRKAGGLSRNRNLCSPSITFAMYYVRFPSVSSLLFSNFMHWFRFNRSNSVYYALTFVVIFYGQTLIILMILATSPVWEYLWVRATRNNILCTCRLHEYMLTKLTLPVCYAP